MRSNRFVGVLVLLLVMLLLAACGGQEALPPTATPSPVPTDTATPASSPTPSMTATFTRTPLPTFTPTDASNPPTAAPTLTPTEELVQEGDPPPFDITLPEGWNARYALVPLRLDVARMTIPVSLYGGPVPGVEGVFASIVVIWGFPSLAPNSEGATGPDLWADGLRFLRGGVLDISCNVGTDLEGRTTFRIGDREDAVGTYFSAVDCLNEADTAGWFAGLNEQGGNFVFYTFTDPLEGIDPARGPLQDILNSIHFHDLSTATPTAAP